MRSLWQDEGRSELKARIARLTPAHPPQWGKMSAAQMVCHLTESMRMATGELPVASKRLPIRFPPLKQLLIYLLPFPKSLPTAPELIARVPAHWHEDVATLTTMVETLGQTKGSERLADHPAFGRVSPRGWGVLIYRHMDHHLRQFGV